MQASRGKRVSSARQQADTTDVNGTLRLVAASDSRRRVLVSLLEGDKSLRELYEGLELASPNVIQVLHDLERCDLVRTDNKRHTLTFVGRGVALKLVDMRAMMGVLKEHEAFWVSHETRGIPDHLLGMMLLLRDSTLLENSPSDIVEAYNRGIELFYGAHEFRFVSAAAMPNAARFLDKFASDQVPLQLVLTRDLLDALTERADLGRVAKTLGDRCQLYVLEQDPKLTLALSDRVMTLMLPRLDGWLDLANTLVARSKDGVTWGTALFKHYVRASKTVSL
jgi:predicted transcriptional regulator